MSGIGFNPLFCRSPTATTVTSLRVVAPNSPLEAVPGSGLLLIVQLVASPCSIRVAVPLVVEEFPAPTAQISLAETAAIPFRKVSWSEPG
jgi:hypothetical protein